MTITKTKLNRYHIFAFITSIGLMLLVLLGVLVSHWFSAEYEPKVMVREITQAYTPPPPPPKPITKQTAQAQLAIDLNAIGTGPSLSVTNVKINEPLEPMISPPEFTPQTQNLNVDLAVDWQAFGLGELDSMPVLLTKIKAIFPRSLARKGITEAKVALDVFIDEQGVVSLIGIKSLPYEELRDSINTIIRTSRFSVPTKNNQPVRARFIWPVEFKKV
jgi:outer membrane biosynthesis protein TonB